MAVLDATMHCANYFSLCPFFKFCLQEDANVIGSSDEEVLLQVLLKENDENEIITIWVIAEHML